MSPVKILLLAVLATSCYSGMDDDYTYIQPEIRPYYDIFIQEAAKRHVDIDTYGVKISFGPMNDDGQQGVTSHRYREMKIDSASYKWKNYPESLVFHELGHLLLHREHNNHRVNYNPISIMDSREIPEYELDREDLREYYLNELFNPSTPLPDGF